MVHKPETKSVYEVWESSIDSNEVKNQKMLREIAHDNITPKKHDFHIQKEIHEKIRNDEDYDDWYYGTEPVYGV